jgi:hypothetical protein
MSDEEVFVAALYLFTDFARRAGVSVADAVDAVIARTRAPKRPAETKPTLPDLPQTKLGECAWCQQAVLGWQYSIQWDGHRYHAGCLSKLKASLPAQAAEPDRGAYVANGQNMADRWWERRNGEAAP